MRGYFISGIDTEIGKTVVSAILTQALGAAYWKPVQAGELDYTDTDKVKSWVSHSDCQFFPERHRLQLPRSPHAAAAEEGIDIQLADFTLPTTDRPLIVEGAGGLLVPLNQQVTILDLIAQLGLPVLLVSKHRLGNINHTLLSVEALKHRGIPLAGIIFNGEEIPGTNSIIAQLGQIPILGTIPTVAPIDSSTIARLAEDWTHLSRL